MPMPFFSRDPAPAPAHVEMAALGLRLDRIAALLEAHLTTHAELPEKVWQHILSEVQHAASAAAMAAWVTIRRKIWEEVSKWA